MAISRGIRTEYDGTTYRSMNEAAWAEFFDYVELGFRYEPEFIIRQLKSYHPDFIVNLEPRSLYDQDVFSAESTLIEVKHSLSFDEKLSVREKILNSGWPGQFVITDGHLRAFPFSYRCEDQHEHSSRHWRGGVVGLISTGSDREITKISQEGFATVYQCCMTCVASFPVSKCPWCQENTHPMCPDDLNTLQWQAWQSMRRRSAEFPTEHRLRVEEKRRLSREKERLRWEEEHLAEAKRWKEANQAFIDRLAEQTQKVSLLSQSLETSRADLLAKLKGAQ